MEARERPRKQTVLIIGEYPPPAGGMAQQAHILHRHLTRAGITVLVCNTHRAVPLQLTHLDKIRFLRQIYRLPRIYIDCLRKLGKADVVHIFSNSYLSFYLYTAIPCLLARLRRRRVHLDYHGGAAEGFFNAQFRFARPFFFMADTLSVPSGFLEAIFRQRGLDAVVIPNLADIQRFPFVARTRFRPRFLVTRHLEPEYGIDTVLSAFQQICQTYPGALLTIAGDGSQAEKLFQLSIALGVVRQVRFLGRVENSALPKLYAQSDVFLNGSRVDNMPMSIIEAFASGLPVVTTRSGGIPYLVEDRKTGLLVSIDDSEAMARKVLELLHTPSLAPRLAANGRQQAERFTWPSIQPKIMRAYGMHRQVSIFPQEEK